MKKLAGYHPPPATPGTRMESKRAKILAAILRFEWLCDVLLFWPLGQECEIYNINYRSCSKLSTDF